MKRLLDVLLFIVSSLVFVLFLITAGCTAINNSQDKNNQASEPFTGMIYELDAGKILVVSEINDANIPREAWFETGKPAIYFHLKDSTIIEFEGNEIPKDQLARGQVVKVWPDGLIAESYPAITAAARIIVVDKTAAEDYLIDSGRYISNPEEHLIEIKISGVPDELPSRLFRLTAEAQEKLIALELKSEENIIFRYVSAEQTEGLIFDVNRIIN